MRVTYNNDFLKWVSFFSNRQGVSTYRCILPFVIILSSCTNNNSDKKYEIVYVENKARQCEYNGLTVDETAGILTKAKMLVIDSDCGYIKSVASASVRGGVTAKINRHTIRVQDLADAKKLGYKSVSALTDSYGNKKYRT